MNISRVALLPRPPHVSLPLVALAAALASATVLGDDTPSTSQRVHAFYYPWYGNPEHDGGYSHWNHAVAVRRGPPRQFPGGDDIGANFYPLMGCSSSTNAADLERHMRWLRRAGVGVISVSWWGDGSFTDRALPAVFRAAEKHGIGISFHIEPHLAGKRRDAAATRQGIVSLIERFGASPALFRYPGRDGRPLFYVYDSYLTEAAEWAAILAPDGARTIRGTAHDAVVIGLWVKEHEEDFMLRGHFDGFYTYFATEGFTYGSTPANWTRLARWAREHAKIFIPCVAPGYIDTRIRPWNGRNTRARRDGAYHDEMFRAAIDVKPQIIGVTSFNEWHEGTQIEPAAPKRVADFTYEDYRPRSPFYYLDRTRHWAAAFDPEAVQPARDPLASVHLRGGLANSRARFVNEKRGHVAFIGGSITEMDGYRPMVCDILRSRFPDTEFTFTDAGIASTCSTTGAFRLEEHVLAHGPVDLLFVEFAVNDDQDAAHAPRECVRGLEGIVRRTRLHNPRADIVVTYFVNPRMLETLRAGRVPPSIASHQQVVERYGIPTVDLAGEVAHLINAGELTWKEFGGTHPAPAGNAICAGLVDGLLTRAWTASPGEPAPHALPEPIDRRSYFRGRFVDPSEATRGPGWSLHTPEWKSLPGHCRARFAKETLLCATEAGASLTLEFEGTAVGAYVLAGPDAGTVEASIDGGAWKAVDLYHRFSRGLHYPRTVVFDGDLPPGRHTLSLRVAVRSNTASRGHAVRILEFVAN